MSSILSSPGNFVISGGQFINNHTAHLEVGRPHSGIDSLRRRSALGALLNSSERFNPPKCAPDTRIAIINAIMEWISNKDSRASMIWLYGPAGAGKSALAQTIAELCQKEGRSAGSFFFSRVDASRSNGQLLVPTLAYQLSLSFPSIRPYLKRIIEADPSIFERGNDTQMEELFVAPLNIFADSWSNLFVSFFKDKFSCFSSSQPQLIVIDGLDECYGHEMHTEILRFVGEAIPKLKLPIKFLITSRPESHILRAFDHDLILEPAVFSKINLSVDNNSHIDIRTFLQREFDAIRNTHPTRNYLPPRWPPPDSIRQIVRKASGQFIYASTVMKYIQSPKHRPDDRLQVILGLSPPPAQEAPFAQLDALYAHIFSSVNNIHAVLRIIGMLIIPRTKGDGLGIYSTPRTIERLLLLKPGDAQLILDDLQSLISFGGHDSPVKILHASLADFLLDSSRSREYFVDISTIHSIVAQGFMKQVFHITSVYIYNPIELQSRMTAFLSHCKRAISTQELLQDILSFDVSSVLKVLIIRYKPWLVLNDFYIWFFLKTLFGVLSQATFERNVRIYVPTELNRLNDFFANQLKNILPESYLRELVTMIEDKPQYKGCLCSHKDHGVKPCHRADAAKSLCLAQYLALLCQLFYWDYSSSFTSNPRLRCVTAVKQCLKYVSADPADNSFAQKQRFLARQFPNSLGSIDDLREAHFDCVLLLLPHAEYSDELALDHFSSVASYLYPERVDITARIIESYIQAPIL